MADKRYTFRGKAVPLFRIGGTPVAEYSLSPSKIAIPKGFTFLILKTIEFLIYSKNKNPNMNLIPMFNGIFLLVNLILTICSSILMRYFICYF